MEVAIDMVETKRDFPQAQGCGGRLSAEDKAGFQEAKVAEVRNFLSAGT